VDRKTSDQDRQKWPGSSFPVFKVDVPMPSGTAPPRSAPEAKSDTPPKR
jgi:hypothetical protein